MQSTQNQFIQTLIQHKNDYISGQRLADTLNISRSAVWKHMKALEEAGYKIEARRNVGYRILEVPDELNEFTLKWDLKTNWLGKTIIHKTTTLSTQLDAHQWAEKGAEHGTIIIADEQTKSVGRNQKKWYSKEKNGIWLSMILKPNIFPYEAPQLTLLSATVLAEMIQKKTGLRPNIKWPNDVFLNNQKVSGILTEMKAEQDNVLYVVIGIGLNVNQKKQDFPEHIRRGTTSLAIETGINYSLVQMTQHLLEIFEKQYDAFIEYGFLDVKSRWESYSYKVGESIHVRTGHETFYAKLLGIAEDGALRIEKRDGTIQKLYSAEINWFEGGL